MVLIASRMIEPLSYVLSFYIFLSMSWPDAEDPFQCNTSPATVAQSYSETRNEIYSCQTVLCADVHDPRRVYPQVLPTSGLLPRTKPSDRPSKGLRPRTPRRGRARHAHDPVHR